jgi:hypothetical protein
MSTYETPMDAFDTYLRELARIDGLDSSTDELSFYTALDNFLSAVGEELDPSVTAVMQLSDQGSGMPDGGLFLERNLDVHDLDDELDGHVPECGAIEVKGADADIESIVDSDQIQRYASAYRRVLVTNLHTFAYVTGEEGGTKILETVSFADGLESLREATEHPGETADAHGERVAERLRRFMKNTVPIREPEELAWFLASYAREGRQRLEEADSITLPHVKTWLEKALGIDYSGDRGDQFFLSTFVQTIFYGMFSAWVLWHRDGPGDDDTFTWRRATEHLQLPVLYSLFEAMTSRTSREAHEVDRLLERTARTLDRVDRDHFFDRFEEDEAVQYFYEPFLEAFDPELRDDLGVWYTPPEVVEYMVENIDRTLREDLDISDGLADDDVYVLDPACGTGAYLVEVLRKIGDHVDENLRGEVVKRAAQERVFGFEIMTAPLVVSHLQIRMLLDEFDVGMDEETRPGVYLTNALTNWEDGGDDGSTLDLPLPPELMEEREAADEVKQGGTDEPIIVVLGNPPYNGFPGVSPHEEERALSDAYREVDEVPEPRGHGLNDLYVRFFRVAERQITERAGYGVVSYISNYSWLDGLSHTGMREHYLNEFDQIRIDSLNGDKYRTGKTTPDGNPDPSIFSTDREPIGIQVGTAVSTLVRQSDADEHGTSEIEFRDLWGQDKKERLQAEAAGEVSANYELLEPSAELGVSFQPRNVVDGYLNWPKLPDLFREYFPGVQTKRDDLVIDTDRDRLIERMEKYFEPSVSMEEMAEYSTRAVTETAAFEAEDTREKLQDRGFLSEYVVSHIYRPMDQRWLYWEPETNLLERKSPDYFPQVFEGNRCLISQRKPRREWSPPPVITSIGNLDLFDRCASCFPLYTKPQRHENDLFDDGGEAQPQPNVTEEADTYLKSVGAEVEELFYHVVAVMHALRYREENVGGLHQDWPRIPLPDSAEVLEASAELGREVADCIDVETEVDGVTTGDIRDELAELGSPETVSGESIDASKGHLAVTAGWSYFMEHNNAVMPKKGDYRERDYHDSELAALERGAERMGRTLEDVLDLLGHRTVDVYINDEAYWANVPLRVWEYTLGGYQVLKKWLTYREKEILERDLELDELLHVRDMARRIAAILLLEPELNENYTEVKSNAIEWEG